MPHGYVRKSYRGGYGKDKIEEALQAMNSDGLSLRHAARTYGVPKSTLERHCNQQLKHAEHYSLGCNSLLDP